MAIDTASKRKAISGIYPIMSAGVTPNLAKDEAWRKQAGWGYVLVTVLRIVKINDVLVSLIHL